MNSPKLNIILVIVSTLPSNCASANTPLPPDVYADGIRPLQECALEVVNGRRQNIEDCVDSARDTLLNESPEVRSDAARYLALVSSHVDVRPLSGIVLQRMQRYNEDADTTALLDLADLRWSTRQHVVNVYEKAIEDGQVVLPWGTVIPRFQAMRAGALEGLFELEPAIRRFYSSLDQNAQPQTYPLEYYTTALWICRNESPTPSGLQSALDYLERADTRTVIEEAAGNPVFAQVVVEVLARSHDSIKTDIRQSFEDFRRRAREPYRTFIQEKSSARITEIEDANRYFHSLGSYLLD